MGTHPKLGCIFFIRLVDSWFEDDGRRAFIFVEVSGLFRLLFFPNFKWPTSSSYFVSLNFYFSFLLDFKFWGRYFFSSFVSTSSLNFLFFFAREMYIIMSLLRHSLLLYQTVYRRRSPQYLKQLNNNKLKRRKMKILLLFFYSISNGKK